MIDQDGVLLDRNYKTTLDLNGFLQKLPRRIVIVPNSDTPIERIGTNFSAIAGIKPDTMIGEKGAIVTLGGKLYSISNIVGIKGYLERLKRVFSAVDCDIAVGDSATWIREQKKFSPDRHMLIIDSMRRQTIGFYLRTTNAEGIACLDDEWFAMGSSIAKTIPLPEGIEARDFNTSYGIVIMNAIGISKTDGFKFLRQRFPQAIFYMIGDGNADIIDDPKVIHCAVANASVDLKIVARFVSDRQITAGLIDCLRWVIRQ